LVEAHPKLRPVDTNTDGIFIAGCAVGPRDIPESVAHGSAAAAKVLDLLSQDTITTEPLTATIDASRCTGCALCTQICPFKAIDLVSLNGKSVAVVNESLCKGCGLCVAACRSSAPSLRGFTDAQILSEVLALCP
jgi:heterodisulfide reductase subunit A